jgi:V/A-type H+-transporting ATPase subunit E
MENKLKELTDKIYAEGILKANQEGEEIIGKAKKDAAELLAKAQREAEQIIGQADRQADEIRKNINAEIHMTVHQTLGSLRQQITSLITLRIVDPPVRTVCSDSEFMAKLIETLIRNWPENEKAKGMQLMLPEDFKKGMDDHFIARLHQALTGGLDLVSDPGLTSGFRIGPKDGSYRISFADEDFSRFIRAYLRPRTQQILFGEHDQ